MVEAAHLAVQVGLPMHRVYAMSLACACLLGCVDLGTRERPVPQAWTPDAAVEAAAVATRSVTIRSIRFYPEAIRIGAGETVTWTNMDPVVHTVTEGWPAQAQHLFDSQRFSTGEVFEHTFTNPGLYYYYCRPHAAQMFGARVYVE